MPVSVVYLNYVRDPNTGETINIGDIYEVPAGNISNGWPPYFEVDTIFKHSMVQHEIYVSATNDVRSGSIYKVGDIFQAIGLRSLELRKNRSMTGATAAVNFAGVAAPKYDPSVPANPSWAPETCQHEPVEGFLLTSTYKYCKKCGEDIP